MVSQRTGTKGRRMAGLLDFANKQISTPSETRSAWVLLCKTVYSDSETDDSDTKKTH